MVKVAVALVIAVVVLIYFVSKPNSGGPADQASNNAPSPPIETTTQSQPAPVAIPPDEQALINTISQYAASYNSASNEMAQGAFRPKRAQAICAIIQAGANVTNWVGTISTLSSNNDGKGVLGISISGIATVSTWNNDLSDIVDNTLIQPGTPLLQRVSAMSVGTLVNFSGNFFSSSTDCLGEQSLTMDGSMTSPDFTFRFSDVEPYSASAVSYGATTASQAPPEPSQAPTSPVAQSTSDDTTDFSQAPTPTPQPPVTQSTALQVPSAVASYDQGHADRVRLENWVNSLQGAERQGVVYWSSQRSLINPGTCEAGAAIAYPNDSSNQQIFEQGCQEGKDQLTPTDIRRKSDPLYKAGWNAPITSSDTANGSDAPVATPPSTSTQQSSNSNSNDNSQSANSDQQTPQFLVPGQKAVLNSDALACIDKTDFQNFSDAEVKAQIANDKVGQQDAVNVALSASCIILNKGGTGLVIDTSGFLDPIDQVRLDRDQNAYWIDLSKLNANGPAPGP